MSQILERLRSEAAALLDSARDVLQPSEQQQVAAELDDYSQLVVRAWSGEAGLEDAIASTRRTLDLWRTAAAAGIGTTFAEAVTRVLTSVFAAVLMGVSGRQR